MAENRTTRRAAAAEGRKTPANAARGETVITVQTRDGEQEFKLCLTLSAIAEIEDGLGIESLAEIDAALQAVSSRKLAVLLSALARGGGHDVSLDDARRWDIRVSDAMAAVAAAFQGAGAVGVDEAGRDAPGRDQGN